MFQTIDLRELSELHGPERAFVSFYGSPARAEAVLSNRGTKLRRLLEDSPVEAEHFEENLRLLHQAIEEQDHKAPGLCVFACWALDFVRGYALPVEVPELLRVDAAPYIRPLAELQDERENFLIVAANNTRTRIVHVTSAEAHEGERIKGDIKNAVKKGGWSQQRYARRRDKQLHHYAKEVADVLGDLCRRESFDRIVLLGSRETLREIEEALPTAVAGKVVGSRPVDLHAGENALLDEAYDLYFDEERDSEVRLWDRIKAEYLRGGLAVAGPEDVLDAARQGRVEAMIVTRDTRIEGRQCRSCEQVSAGPPAACPSCGSDALFPVDLVDALVRQLELTSAETEFSDRIEGLTQLGEVAALLRY